MAPIAYPPAAGSSVSSDSSKILYSDVVVPVAPALPLGTAVAVFDNAGTLEFAKCGANAVDYPDAFAGFMNAAGVAGQTAAIITGRGSKVTPIVTGAIPLVVGDNVYLSTTAGEVTQTAPAGAGVTVLRVGNAITTTKMVLTTDFYTLVT
jgi:hypothetical protein